MRAVGFAFMMALYLIDDGFFPPNLGHDRNSVRQEPRSQRVKKCNERRCIQTTFVFWYQDWTFQLYTHIISHVQNHAWKSEVRCKVH